MPRDKQILLVSMPWATSWAPSLQLATLSAYLRRRGLACDTLLAFLPLVQMLGVKTYEALTSVGWRSELLFAKAFNGRRMAGDFDLQSIADQILRVSEHRVTLEFVDRTIERYFEYLTAKIPWERYPAVGFSVTFSQLAASLLLAERIKAKHPDILIIFGGANCTGEMGRSLLEHFRFIDFVVDGEGEAALYELLSTGRLQGEGSRAGSHRYPEERITNTCLHGSPIATLDELPFPDYGDYFEQIRGTELVRPMVSIPLEGSRGCWWHKCSFCALNNGLKTYRSKSPQRVLEEILEGTKRYRCLTFHFVDTLLDYSSIDELLALLCEARKQHQFTLSGEFRAHLTKEQVRLMAQAGFDRIQIGVESLSTDILKRMRKGTLALQNVQVLKWCQEFGIRAYYNIIARFPSEDPTEVREMTTLASKLHHLYPPSVPNYSLQRNSPIFESPHLFGVKNIRIMKDYEQLYPEAVSPRWKGLFHTYEEDPVDGLHEARASLADELSTWRAKHFLNVAPANNQAHDEGSSECPELTVRDGGEFLEFFDSRREKPVIRQVPNPLARAVYQFCDSFKTYRQIYERFQSVPHTAIDAVVEMFVSQTLMAREKDRLLALAVRYDRQYSRYRTKDPREFN